MQQPHGGHLIERYATKDISEVDEYPHFEISVPLTDDVVNIATGIFSPLEGFLCHNDLDCVLQKKRLETDIPWTIPILCDVAKTEIQDFTEGDTVVLVNKETGTLALLDIEDIYTHDKKHLVEAVYGTTDPSHPGVAGVYTGHEYFLGGPVSLIKTGSRKFDDYYLTPKETRYHFHERGWKEIVAFQTRNPPHIGHEYVQKTALTFRDGLFINPIIGKKKVGDFTDEIILASYDVLIKNYFIKERVLLSILRTAMRYAGPREAIHHAIMRKNFGCTHFIVGRDHAGVGDFYGPYDAHMIFSEFPDLGITPVFFRSFFQCMKCGSVVNDKICPHDDIHHVNISGKKIREALQRGERPSEDLMRKEVADTILDFTEKFVK